MGGVSSFCSKSNSHITEHRLMNDTMMLPMRNDYSKDYGSVSNKKTGIILDERVQKHFQCQRKHPERPERLEGILKELEDQFLLKECVLFIHRANEETIKAENRLAVDEELLFCHTLQHICRVDESREKSIERETDFVFGRDTYANPDTAQAARIAAGCLLELTMKVLNEDLNNGFAVVRPPGHHASKDEVMGFCFYNNVAIAAKAAIRSGKANKVLIVDWDVHHGNGTQAILEEDPFILYFSVHRRDNGGFFPGTGAATEVGKGAGEGFCVNVPWKATGMGDAEYMECFRKILVPIALEFGPDLVLVSCGFDCAIGDPIGGMNVTPQGFGHLTSMVSKLAKNQKVVLALEGGYSVEALGKCAAECVKVLLGKEPSSLENSQVSQSAVEVFQEVIQIQKQYWKCFE